jgi:DNA polymerase-1
VAAAEAPAPLIAADAPLLLYRSFFALPDSIRGAEGRPVNALLGSVNLALRTVAAWRPRAVAMCFGQDAADYRGDLYEGYHAHRPPVPDELEPQMAEAPRLYEALGWHSLDTPCFEADDLLHSVALAEERAGGRTLILTGDRDLFQCAGPSCSVLYLRPGRSGPEVVDAAGVERRYGVPPALVPDFIALRGDPSDGLPGAKGIGEKTAADLLRRHGSLEAAIAAAGGERPRVAAALRDGADELRRFREIAALRDLGTARPPDRATDLGGGATAARELGMARLAERLETGIFPAG